MREESRFGRWLASSLVSLGALGTSASTAVAENDLHVFNGAACTFISDGAGQTRNGYLWNTSGSTRTAECGVVRERTDGNIAGASVVMDAVIPQNNCTLRGRLYSGGDLVTYSPDDSINLGNGVANVRWAPGAPNLNFWTNGSIWFRCTLPNDTAIYSFLVDE